MIMLTTFLTIISRISVRSPGPEKVRVESTSSCPVPGTWSVFKVGLVEDSKGKEDQKSRWDVANQSEKKSGQHHFSDSKSGGLGKKSDDDWGQNALGQTERNAGCNEKRNDGEEDSTQSDN